jgi:hypothetical protein
MWVVGDGRAVGEGAPSQPLERGTAKRVASDEAVTVEMTLDEFCGPA